MRLTVPCLVVLAVVTAAPAGAEQQLAEVTEQVPISAHHGWVVWSAKVRGRYQLFSWHDGLTRKMLVASRARPFDVDIGTDAEGRDVATFSRCRRFRAIKVYEASRREIGVACRLRAVDLLRGHEHDAGVPAVPGTSDSMPSMWRGRVAFARRDPRNHKDVDQVLLWSPRERTLTRLRHGGVPTTCPFRDKRYCANARVSGEVTGLDLGRRLVAFSWRLQAPAVEGFGGYEVRADRLSDGQSALVGSGYIGEACTGGVDGTTPAAPVVEGDRVWYSQTQTACYHVTARLNAYRAFPPDGRRGGLDGVVLQAVKDGSLVYELTAPPIDKTDRSVRCTPCTITQAPPPPLEPIRLRPHSPFF
jgi:hypothetical protein